jgi:uridine kinase
MLIGISGKKQSGKNTVAKMIQHLTDYPNDDYSNFEHFTPVIKSFREKSYAHKLKKFVADLIGCDVEQLEDNDFKNKELGEEWVRYSYANGHITDNKGNTTMLSKQCSKDV